MVMPCPGLRQNDPTLPFLPQHIIWTTTWVRGRGEEVAFLVETFKTFVVREGPV